MGSNWNRCVVHELPAAARRLFEVLHSGLEHPDVVLAGNVLVQTLCNTLAVTHLTEDTTVGRGDAFDGTQRTVGVEAEVWAIGRRASLFDSVHL